MDVCPTSLLLTNYNGVRNGNLERYLPRIVESANQTAGVEEVVLVDDGSADGSCDFVRERFPSVRLECLPVNHGFSVAANAGFEACACPYVFLVSNDMLPRPGWLQFLAPHFADPAVFAVSGRLCYEDGRPQSYRLGLRMRRGRLQGLHLSQQPSVVDAERQRFYHFGHAWSLFDRAKFTEMGGFDASLFLPFHIEDEDLFYRAWKRGWTVVLDPRAEVVHYHESSTIWRAFGRRRVERTIRTHRLLHFWKNVTDRGFMARHLGWLLFRLSFGWVVGDIGFYGSFRDALRRLPAAMRRRTEEEQVRKLSDREILRAMDAVEPVTSQGGTG